MILKMGVRTKVIIMTTIMSIMFVLIFVEASYKPPSLPLLDKQNYFYKPSVTKLIDYIVYNKKCFEKRKLVCDKFKENPRLHLICFVNVMFYCSKIHKAFFLKDTQAIEVSISNHLGRGIKRFLFHYHDQKA